MIASVWLAYETIERLSAVVTVLAEYQRQTTWLSLLGLASHAVGMLLLFAWSVWRVQQVKPRPQARAE